MNHFFVITNQPKDKNLEITKYIVDFFQKHGRTCSYVSLENMEEELAKNNQNPLQIDERTECILVIGGDGTLLQAARDTLYLDIPLLGINYGSLGFLAEVEKGNLDEALENLLESELEIEKRMMLTGNIFRSDVETQEETSEKDHALNDIVLTRQGSLKILNFDIYVNGQFLNHYSADGVIVSTPTGSTGYNMSAGGPIVEPKAELLLITPICPHTLNTRSIILSPEDKVEVRIPIGKNGHPQEVEVNFDGNHKGILRTGDRICITKSGKVTKFVRINQVSFLEVLHKKMSE
ncbi:MAG: NAD(+)/NADH kinase [Lachnospiraceae bacterium]|nr:NAD(+)/NADH kinase [Lachnospiraceae bacterium]